MASTFHTPSFGDEDFNLPPLTLPTPDGSPDLFMTAPGGGHAKYGNVHMSAGGALPPQTVTSLSTPSQGHMVAHHPQGQTHTYPPHTYPTPHSNGYPVTSSLSYQQHDLIHQDYGGGGSFLPKFPPQTFDIPDLQISNSLQGPPGADPSCDSLCNGVKNPTHVTGGHLSASGPVGITQPPHHTMTSSSPPTMLIAPPGRHPPPTALDGGTAMMPPSVHTPHHHPHSGTPQISPPGSNTTSPGRESSAEESSGDDCLPMGQLQSHKRIAPAVPHKKTTPTQPAAKKPRTPKKRKKKDPNEPQKPVSAYALFFRDTQAAIKTRNPSASFGEVSKIVASMWDGLAEDHKNDYKKRTETAKKEYLKQLAAYRATLVSKGALENGDGSNNNRTANSSPKQPIQPQQPQPQQQQQQQQQQPTPQQQQPTQQQQQQQQHSSSPHQVIMSSPAMSSGPPMGSHHSMTTSMSMSLPGQHVNSMPPPPHLANPAGLMPNPGHMMPTGPPPHHQQAPYGMPMGHNVGHMGAPPPPHMGMSGMSPSAMVTSPPEAMGLHHDNYMGSQVLPSSPPMAMDSPVTVGAGPGGAGSMCVRNGCANPAIVSPGWDNEYCSNDCVVNHCRDAFSQWVAARQGSSPYASVK